MAEWYTQMHTDTNTHVCTHTERERERKREKEFLHTLINSTNDHTDRAEIGSYQNQEPGVPVDVPRGWQCSKMLCCPARHCRRDLYWMLSHQGLTCLSAWDVGIAGKGHTPEQLGQLWDFPSLPRHSGFRLACSPSHTPLVNVTEVESSRHWFMLTVTEMYFIFDW